MKKLGILALIVGLVCAAAGIFGYIAISQSGYGANEVDMILSLGSAFGAQSYLSATDKALLYVMQNRGMLLGAGIAGAVLGAVLVYARRDD